MLLKNHLGSECSLQRNRVSRAESFLHCEPCLAGTRYDGSGAVQNQGRGKEKRGQEVEPAFFEPSARASPFFIFRGFCLAAARRDRCEFSSKGPCLGRA